MEENINFLDVGRIYNEKSIRELSPLVLAYVGDSIYDLLVRTHITKKNINIKNLHINSIKYVSAKAQSELINKVYDNLTEEEIEIFKRGRNAKSHTVPKNQELSDYKRATGLEALFGYLYLLNRHKRLVEIFEEMIK